MLKSPFPWFGGKSRAADLIWSRFGDCYHYIEPFAGSLAVLLQRPPSPPRVETVNDLDGFISNFWRALQAQPAELEQLVGWPVNEADLHARHLYLIGQRETLTSRLMADPDFYDVKIAAWWVWGASIWVGSGWCSGAGPWRNKDGLFVREPLSDEPGVSRQIPHLGGGGQHGQGVHRLNGWGCHELAERLRKVRVACGDWSRVLTDVILGVGKTTGILLDPPYDEGYKVYSNLTNRVSSDVRTWAKKAGERLDLRIALCGYADEHDELLELGWDKESWKAGGGYGSQGSNQAKENSALERIWFSPGCLRPLDDSVLSIF